MPAAETAKLVAELSFKDGLTGGVNKALLSVGKLESRLDKIGAHATRGIRNAGRNIEKGIVVGLAAAGGALTYATKQAIDWESAIAGVSKTVEGDISAISDGLRQMALNLPIEGGAAGLAAIAEAAGALGVAKADILGFTEVVAKLSVTTNLTAEDAATALGHLKTTLNLTGDDFVEFGDSLVELGNKGASTESQILSMAENIAGAANIMGASKEEVLGWAAALANTGEEAEAGGSSIQRFWIASFKNVEAGGAKLRLMAKTVGLTADAFKDAFGKDATGTLATFVTQLGELSKAEQLAVLEALGFTDVRITRALLKLTSNTDNLTDSLNTAAAAQKALDEEAAKRFGTTAAVFQTLRNNIDEAAIVIGSALLPQLAELGKEATGWLRDNQGAVKEFAADLATGLKDAVKWAKSLDWEGIGNSLKTAAMFGKGLVQAFLSMPDWVKTAVITGWGLNKLTGGAVTGIIGELGKGLIKGVLGMNAGVVNIRAGVVNGAGGTGGGGFLGGGGGKAGALKLVGLAGLITLLTGGIEEQNKPGFKQGQGPLGGAKTPVPVTDPALTKTVTTEQAKAIQAAKDGTHDTRKAISDMQHAIDAFSANWQSGTRQAADEATRRGERETTLTQSQIKAINSVKTASDAVHTALGTVRTAVTSAGTSQSAAVGRAKAAIDNVTRTVGQAKSAIDTVRAAAAGTTTAIQRKSFSSNVTVNNTLRSQFYIDGRRFSQELDRSTVIVHGVSGGQTPS